VNATEVAFFALAVLLPLVGGGALLYALSRDSKDRREESPTPPKDET
jgi:hypothetical protein